MLGTKVAHGTYHLQHQLPLAIQAPRLEMRRPEAGGSFFRWPSRLLLG